MKDLRPFSICYAGDLVEGWTCWQRMRALARLGHSICQIDTRECASHPLPKFHLRTANWLYRNGLAVGLPDYARANGALRRAVSDRWFDIIWLDRCLTIKAKTLAQLRSRIPRPLIVGYSADDMSGRHNQSTHFLDSLPLYDVYFTTKSFGVTELASKGCRRPVFVPNSYDPVLHRPIDLPESQRRELGGPVGFVGSFEESRAASIRRLADAGIPVRVYGNGWKAFRTHPNVRVENKAMLGDDYARAICAFDINLCFLRKVNRDLQTTRSVEIPACGAFMLAERTDEHRNLFVEGTEAEFFSSDDELILKCHRYLADAKVRQEIGSFGRRRCLSGGYSHDDRLQAMLKILPFD